MPLLGALRRRMDLAIVWNCLPFPRYLAGMYVEPR